MHNVLCVIPARGGSKGIFKKNLRPLGGKPLVEHSIEQAILAGIELSRIVLSSDDSDILEIAAKHKITACYRPKEISGDNSSTEETLLHAVEHTGWVGKDVLLLQATSPIRLCCTINRFIKCYRDKEYDSALTVTKFHNFFWFDDGLDGDGIMSTYDPANRPMRQQLTSKEARFFDNGNMYLTNTSVLKETKNRLGGKVGMFVISELEGMQIDTHYDLMLFEAIFDGKVNRLIESDEET